MPVGHGNGDSRRQEPQDIVFSLEDGIVMASWSSTEEAVPLGPVEAVAAMMEDFLAQTRFAEQLMDRVSGLNAPDAPSEN